MLGLLGMIVMALISVAQSNIRPSYARDSTLIRGEKTSAVQWVSKCKGGREPQSGALMRILRRVFGGGVSTPCTSLVCRTQSLMVSHDGNPRLSTVTSTRFSLMPFGAYRYWGQWASRYDQECWQPAHPPVGCSVVSPLTHQVSGLGSLFVD